MTNGLGGLIGGIGLGYVADRFGFTGVCEVSSLVCVFVVLGGLLCMESPVPVLAASEGGGRKGSAVIAVPLLLLLAAQTLVAFTNASGNLGRSLAMNSGGYSKLAIDVTGSIQGLVALGFPLLLGWLSDRIGRRSILIGAYLVVSSSLVVLAFSRSVWHFYIFAGLYAFLAIPPSIAPAYVMDMVPRASAGKGVSLIQSMFWVGSIGGMASFGTAFDKLGTFWPILFSCLFPLSGVVLLLLMRKQAR